MSNLKDKLINYKVSTELELKIEAAVQGMTLNKYISFILDKQAEILKKKRNLTM